MFCAAFAHRADKKSLRLSWPKGFLAIMRYVWLLRYFSSLSSLSGSMCFICRSIHAWRLRM